MRPQGGSSFSRFLAFSALLLFLFLSGKTAAFRADQYALRLSPASDQLLQQTVTKIFQDKDDFLWILTQEGLHRYDGFEVISFRTSRTLKGAITHQFTTDIVESEDGGLWISTLGGGLNQLNRQDLTFTALRAQSAVSNERPLSDYISSMELSQDGAIWVGYSDGSGFSSFDPISDTFNHYFLPTKAPNSSVEAFVDISDETTLIAVAATGLFVLNKLTDEVTQFMPNSPSSLSDNLRDPTELRLLKNGKVLITTYQSGAYVFDPSSSELFPHALNATSPDSVNIEIYTAFEDAESNHWFGTSGGIAVVSRLEETTWLTSFSTALPNDQVLDIFQSKSGMMWIGTFSGLAEGTPTLFQAFSDADGLASNNVNSIVTRGEKEWWIGTDRGISVLVTDRDADSEWRVSQNKATLLDEYIIMSLAVEGDYVWAGTLRSGLFRIDTRNYDTKRYTEQRTASNSLASNGITSILPHSEDTIYIGTFGGGLNVLDTRTDSFEQLKRVANDPDSISDDRVISLAADKSGRIWIGTLNGLNSLDPSTRGFTKYAFDSTDPTTISSPVVLSVVEDSLGNLWVGTRSGGLNLWRKTNRELGYPLFEQFDLGGGLPSSDIYGVLEGPQGELWVTHNAGLSKITPSDASVINFDESNGLQGREFNHGAAYKAENGTLLFGGPFGFNTVDPQRNFEDVFNPRLILTSIKKQNEQIFFATPYSRLESISLENNYQFLSIEFSALEYRRPETTRYRYQISELQGDWIDLGSTRQVTLSGVPHGNYDLRIQGTNASGRWSDNEINLRININPPAWLSWYAYVLYAAIIAAFIAYIWAQQHRKTANELARRMELERRVEERTADLQEARLEAEQAAKAKSDFLAAMSHEIRTPMHGMLGMTELLLQSNLSSRQEPLARAAKSSGKALLELVDSILDYSKADAKKLQIHPEDFVITDLIDEVCYLLSERARQNGTTIAPIWRGPAPTEVNGDAGKLRQVLTNLVGNAIKFTKNGEVIVWCKCEAQPNNRVALEVSVDDTGIGISEEKLETIFEVFTQADASTTRQYGGTGLGLAISKELMGLLGGEISVTSKVNQGSSFSIKMPLHLGADESWTSQQVERTILCVSPKDNLFRSFTSKALHAGYEVRRLDTTLSLSNADASGVVFLNEKILQLEPEFVVCKTHCVLHAHPHQGTEGVCAHISSPFPTKDITAVASGNLFLSDANDRVTGTSSETRQKEMDEARRADIDILIVEDVLLNQQIASAMLERTCRSVDVVSNGKEAVSAAMSKYYDVIFMDCQMPVMDGFEATKAIRKLEQSRNSSPSLIVALTAASGTSDKSRAQASGMNDFIRKPFTQDDLSRILDTFRREPQDALDNTHRTSIEADRTAESKLTELAEDTPILDQAVYDSLKELAGNNHEQFVVTLRNGFVEQLEEKLSVMCDGSWTSNKPELSRVAHAIKSMSASIGALQIRQLAESIEKTPDAWNDEAIQNVVLQIRRLAGDFVAAFDAQLHQ